jgi:hypothetical protein
MPFPQRRGAPVGQPVSPSTQQLFGGGGALVPAPNMEAYTSQLMRQYILDIMRQRAAQKQALVQGAVPNLPQGF